MTVDTVSVAYPSLEELVERQEVIEDRIINYIKDNPEGRFNSINSNIKINKDSFILEIELLKD